MKIVQRWDKNNKEFQQVDAGSVFELNDKTYMKLDYFNTHQQGFNAIDLVSAKFAHIQPKTKVEVFPDAEVHLK